jgi:hypothetical protein
MLLSPRRDHPAKAIAADLQVTMRGLARLLRERVKHINRISERREIENAMRALDLDSDLPHARSDVRHGLPVIRIEALLNAT